MNSDLESEFVIPNQKNNEFVFESEFLIPNQKNQKI